MIYKEGVCSICNGSCDPVAYMHMVCAIAYTDMKKAVLEFYMTKFGELGGIKHIEKDREEFKEKKID